MWGLKTAHKTTPINALVDISSGCLIALLHECVLFCLFFFFLAMLLCCTEHEDTSPCVHNSRCLSVWWCPANHDKPSGRDTGLALSLCACMNYILIFSGQCQAAIYQHQFIYLLFSRTEPIKANHCCLYFTMSLQKACHGWSWVDVQSRYFIDTLRLFMKFPLSSPRPQSHIKK